MGSNYIKKMPWLSELLRQENTGCTDCLSRTLCVLRWKIYCYLELRLKGADIYFSKCKRRYYLKNNFCFTKDFL